MVVFAYVVRAFAGDTLEPMNIETLPSPLVLVAVKPSRVTLSPITMEPPEVSVSWRVKLPSLANNVLPSWTVREPAAATRVMLPAKVEMLPALSDPPVVTWNCPPAEEAPRVSEPDVLMPT